MTVNDLIRVLQSCPNPLASVNFFHEDADEHTVQVVTYCPPLTFGNGTLLLEANAENLHPKDVVLWDETDGETE